MRLPQTPRSYFWVCLIAGLAFTAAGVAQIVSNTNSLQDAHRARARSVLATVVAHQAPVDGQVAETLNYRSHGRRVAGAVLYNVAAQDLTPVGDTVRVVPDSDDPKTVDALHSSDPSAVSWIEIAGWIVVAGALFTVSLKQRRRIIRSR
jgi:hypothetical protein